MRNLTCWMALMVLLPISAAQGRSATHEEPWGTLADGTAITRYTLINSPGASVSFMALGAAILSLKVPDRNGHLADVVLGYDQPSDYNNNNSPEFGLTIGRYANRIIGARFTLADKVYNLIPTGRGTPPMTMHGGPQGFGTRVWSPSKVHTKEGDGMRFTLVSPDGDQGFPGEMTTTVTYIWTEDERLIIDYGATTSKPTVINLTQHSYFNLAGAGQGDILNQELKIDADFYTFALPNNAPTGEIRSVQGTPFDFTQPKPIGRDIESSDPQMAANRGYNQNFVLRRSTVPGELAEAAVLQDSSSGRKLTVYTVQPGLFLYTANFISTSRIMKGGSTYPLRAGVAMEIGHFPDAPNQPHFPRTTLMPGQKFRARTVWAFGAE
jgi:aldose 1-epimerase